MHVEECKENAFITQAENEALMHETQGTYIHPVGPEYFWGYKISAMAFTSNGLSELVRIASRLHFSGTFKLQYYKSVSRYIYLICIVSNS